MQVQTNYQGLDSSPWMEEFMLRRLEKLERFLGSAATVQITLKFENKHYTTSLAIHGLLKDYAFTGEGENLYESFSQATEKANRHLSENKKKIKDRIHRRIFSSGNIAEV